MPLVAPYTGPIGPYAYTPIRSEPKFSLSSLRRVYSFVLLLDYRIHAQSVDYEESLLLLLTLPPVGSFYKQDTFLDNLEKCDCV